MLEKRRLKKILGVAFGIAVGVGGTIGAGILRNPGSAAALVPNASLLILCWLIGGLYILLSVGSLAELSAMLPKAGGTYNYVQEAFGSRAGFIVGWFDYFMNVMAPAYFCIIIAEYIGLLVPVVVGSEKILALGVLILFTLLQYPGVQYGSTVQKMSSFIKLLVFLLLIILLFSYAEPAWHVKEDVKAIPEKLLKAATWLGIFKALQLILGTYDGWMGACFFAEENKDPGKSLPKALFMGVGLVIAIYMLVNIALLYVMPVAQLSGNSLAASEAAMLVAGNNGKIVVTVVSVVSLISILNVYMMIPSRILYGLSRDGYYINKGSLINKGGTPVVALLSSTLLSAILILVGSFENLFSLATFISLIILSGVYLSVFKLRKTRPELVRPYRAKGFPYVNYLLIFVTSILIIGFAWADWLSFGIIIFLGIFAILVFEIFIKPRLKNNQTEKIHSDTIL